MNESWESWEDAEAVCDASDAEAATNLIKINKLSFDKEKEEIEKGNIQSVNELFNVIPTNVELNPVKKIPVLTNISDYAKYAKECARTTACNKERVKKSLVQQKRDMINKHNEIFGEASYLEEDYSSIEDKYS